MVHATSYPPKTSPSVVLANLPLSEPRLETSIPDGRGKAHHSTGALCLESRMRDFELVLFLPVLRF